MDNIRLYTLNVWLTTLFVAPLLDFFIGLVSGQYGLSFFMLAFVVIFGGCVSIPSAIVLDLFIRFLITRKLSSTRIKCWLSVMSSLLCCGPLFFLNGFKFYPGDIHFIRIYYATALLAIWIYKLNIDRSDEEPFSSMIKRVIE